MFSSVSLKGTLFREHWLAPNLWAVGVSFLAQQFHGFQIKTSSDAAEVGEVLQESEKWTAAKQGKNKCSCFFLIFGLVGPFKQSEKEVKLRKAGRTYGTTREHLKVSRHEGTHRWRGANGNLHMRTHAHTYTKTREGLSHPHPFTLFRRRWALSCWSIVLLMGLIGGLLRKTNLRSTHREKRPYDCCEHWWRVLARAGEIYFLLCVTTIVRKMAIKAGAIRSNWNYNV